MTILGVRDTDARKAIELRELTDGDDVAKLFAARRAQYSPPRYEVVVGVADSLETFTRVYPRFAHASAAPSKSKHTSKGGDHGTGRRAE